MSATILALRYLALTAPTVPSDFCFPHSLRNSISHLIVVRSMQLVLFLNTPKSCFFFWNILKIRVNMLGANCTAKWCDTSRYALDAHLFRSPNDARQISLLLLRHRSFVKLDVGLSYRLCCIVEILFIDTLCQLAKSPTQKSKSSLFVRNKIRMCCMF